MATRNHDGGVEIKGYGEAAWLVTWTGLLNGDVGQAFEMPSAADRSIHFSGTFGAGGTIKMRGSNTGTNYLDMTDPQGNAISKTAEAIEQISEVARYMRPEVTAGDGSTDLTATMLVVRKRSR